MSCMRVLLTVALTVIVLAAGGNASAQVAAPAQCTSDNPCRVRVLFGYTAGGLEHLRAAANRRLPQERRRRLDACVARGGDRGYCVLDQIAAANVLALDEAFRVSGVTDVDGEGRRSIVFEVEARSGAGVDAGVPAAARADNAARRDAPDSLNRCLLRELGVEGSSGGRGCSGASIALDWARGFHIAVVYSGAGSNRCSLLALEDNGVIVMSGCLVRGYFASDIPQGQLMFLHEAGHTFGAAHNDNANPQPCSEAARSGLSPTACAWEVCLRPGCNLRSTADAFCTLVGQYNYTTVGRSYCQVHTGGEAGTGWIREYSHPGRCRTSGFTQYECGDATHNARDAMRVRAWTVANTQAGRRRARLVTP